MSCGEMTHGASSQQCNQYIIAFDANILFTRVDVANILPSYHYSCCTQIDISVHQKEVRIFSLGQKCLTCKWS